MSSKRANRKQAKATASTRIPDIASLPSWPAIMFRREASGSWEKLTLAEGDGTTTGDDFSPVIPYKGCILLPVLRQKWSLQNDEHTGVMIRRGGDKLLFRSRGRVRVLMLQFASLEDCLEFSDRFVALNPPPPPVVEHPSAAMIAASPKRQLATPRQTTGRDRGDDNINQRQAQAQPSTQQLLANGLVARLLHDDEFLRFVHKLETYLKSTSDGALMLQGLQGRDLSNTT